MLIRKAPDLTYADVTPKSVYLDRRKFLRAMGIVGATVAAGNGLFELSWPPQTAFAATKLTGLGASDELGEVRFGGVDGVSRHV